MMQPITTDLWYQYQRRAQLDAVLRSAAEILKELHDEGSIAELEMLRKRNVARMSKIQNAAYQYREGKERPRRSGSSIAHR